MHSVAALLRGSPAPLGIPYLATRPTSLSGFTGSPDTLREMVEAAQGDRGERSMVVRGMLDEIVAQLQPKDYAGEVVAVRNWVAEYIRYSNDPLHVELVKSPQTLIEEVIERGVGVGDCDDIACTIATLCLQLGRVCQFIPCGFGEAGHYSHVFTRVQEPRTGRFIVCDPVAGTDERQMCDRITTYQIWSLDEPPDHGPIGGR